MSDKKRMVAEIARVLNLPEYTTKAVITLDPSKELEECMVELTMYLPYSKKELDFKYNIMKLEPYDLNKISV